MEFLEDKSRSFAVFITPSEMAGDLIDNLPANVTFFNININYMIRSRLLRFEGRRSTPAFLL